MFNYGVIRQSTNTPTGEVDPPLVGGFPVADAGVIQLHRKVGPCNYIREAKCLLDLHDASSSAMGMSDLSLATMSFKLIRRERNKRALTAPNTLTWTSGGWPRSHRS